MFKNMIFSIILFFLAVVIVVAGAEIILRILKGVPDSPLALITQDEKNQHYLFTPNSEFTSESSIEGEFEYVAHINSHGYRGKEFNEKKPAGMIRIMAIGDSFTFGVGSTDDETFAALIEKGIIDKGVRVEVINAGVGHASTVRHWDNLQKIHLQYKPDMVVLFFDMTDLSDDWRWDRHAVWSEDGTIEKFDLDFYYGKRKTWLTLVHKSALCKYLQNKVVRPFKKLQMLGVKRYWIAKREGKRAKAVIINSLGEFSDDVVMEYDGLAMMRGRERKSLIDKHWLRTTKYLTMIRDLLAEQDIPFAIVMYPHGLYVGEDQWNEGRKAWGFEQNKKYADYYPFELMKDFTGREGILFINTLPGFLSAPKEQYFYNWDGHMTPAGNKIVAQQILTHEKFLELFSR